MIGRIYQVVAVFLFSFFFFIKECRFNSIKRNLHSRFGGKAAFPPSESTFSISSVGTPIVTPVGFEQTLGRL